jgi:hypothetical protein
MSVGNDARAFFACLGKRYSVCAAWFLFARHRRATGLLETITVASLAEDHAAKWFYLPKNTLNFEQCPFQSHASVACARLTR